MNKSNVSLLLICIFTVQSTAWANPGVRQSARQRVTADSFEGRSEFALKAYSTGIDQAIKSGKYADPKTGSTTLLRDFEKALGKLEVEMRSQFNRVSEDELRTILESVRKNAADTGNIATYEQLDALLNSDSETPLSTRFLNSTLEGFKKRETKKLTDALARNEGSAQKLLVSEKERLLSKDGISPQGQIMLSILLVPVLLGVWAVDTALLPVTLAMYLFSGGRIDGIYYLCRVLTYV